MSHFGSVWEQPMAPWESLYLPYIHKQGESVPEYVSVANLLWDMSDEDVDRFSLRLSSEAVDYVNLYQWTVHVLLVDPALHSFPVIYTVEP